MTNLPAALRERLSHGGAIALPQIVRRYVSSDGTVRYVLATRPRESPASMSKPCSCRRKIARRSAFRRRQAARWIAVFA